jgi:hypothetical protein
LETKFKIATTFLIAGIICFLLFYLIETKVDENGWLVEPFFLLPVGFSNLILSIFLFILLYITKKK